MTEHADLHAPSASFRATLQRDIVHTYRRDTRFGRTETARRATRWRTVLAMAAGACLAAGAGFASAQVQDARQRTELSQALEARLELARARTEMARTQHDIARQQYDRGALTHEALLAAERERRTAELGLARVELDLEEINATSASPRDDLSAPRVNGRDFVTDRLTLEMRGAQSELDARQKLLADVERGFAVGTVAQHGVTRARLDLLTAREALDVLGMKLTLRRGFLDQGLAPGEVGRRLQHFELTGRLARLEQELELARSRLALSTARVAVGAAGAIEALRADVEVQERQLELMLLRRQLDALGRALGRVAR